MRTLTIILNKSLLIRFRIVFAILDANLYFWLIPTVQVIVIRNIVIKDGYQELFEVSCNFLFFRVGFGLFKRY